MKKFRFDPWLLILALLLALGMALTLLYGQEETSRHGYGRHPASPSADQQPGISSLPAYHA